MLKLLFAIFLYFIIPVHHCDGQTLSTDSKRAVKFYEEGRKEFGLQHFEVAKQALKKAISADDQFLEAYMLMGDVLKSLDETQAAIDVYEKVIQINPEKYPEVFYFSGLLHFGLQQYDQSVEKLNHFLSVDKKNALRVREAEFYLACSIFAQNAIINPVPFDPQNLGENINTVSDEFINAVSSDELHLYFTGRDPESSQTHASDRFFRAFRESDSVEWSPSKLVAPPLNTKDNQGALSITPDGRYLLFTGCQWSEGYGSCDIYASKIMAGKFSEPQNLGSPVNSSTWDSQPSLGSDGRTLYFASKRTGGFGKSDIWKSSLQEDGSWSIPENLGEVINTPGSEMAPFIHPDGKTLYFSSDRHVGMGGIDLFVTRLDPTGNWSVPENLGYPVNTPGDEINILVNAPGNKAYISAKLTAGLGGFDIYEFELHEPIRPEPSTYIKGVISDSKTEMPLSANFVLIHIQTGEEMIRSFSDEKTGEFLLCIPTKHDYALNVAKEGYLFFSENFSLTGFNTIFEPFLMDISLRPIVPGETTILKNIFFDSGKTDLKIESIGELRKLKEFLEHNLSVSIEISGHTDNIGGEKYNLDLSNERAKSVVDFLVKNGIAGKRLQFRGYGFSNPIADNETEEGRAANRRTEIKIIEIVR
ncbi:MAG: PD40 domain-containing protein [Bacteroidales bacterium]|nr:PD40 domain-containing protein [Bacteroidales bacterium]